MDINPWNCNALFDPSGRAAAEKPVIPVLFFPTPEPERKLDTSLMSATPTPVIDTRGPCSIGDLDENYKRAAFTAADTLWDGPFRREGLAAMKRVFWGSLALAVVLYGFAITLAVHHR